MRTGHGGLRQGVTAKGIGFAEPARDARTLHGRCALYRTWHLLRTADRPSATGRSALGPCTYLMTEVFQRP